MVGNRQGDSRTVSRRSPEKKTMATKSAELPKELVEESAIGVARPVRMRKGKRARSSAQSRERNSKRKGSAGGIHLRANKRMAW